MTTMTSEPTEAATLRVSQAARFLGVHPHTLRAWADQGRLPYLRLNARGDRRFRVADLRRFQADSSQPPAAPAAPRRRAGASTGTTDWEAQIDSIAKLGTRLNHLSTVSEIGTAICAELRQLIDYHNVRVYRVRGDDVVPVAWHGEIGEYTDETVQQLQVSVGEGITGWVALHRQAVYLPDAAHDPRAVTMPGTEDELDESMLIAPMLFEDQAIGVIVLSKMGLDRFAPHDLRYLGIYASIAAQAMVNADISERLRAQQEALDQQLHSQRELLRVTEAILTNLDPAAVIAEVADTIGEVIPVDTLGVYVHEPSQRLLRPMLARGVGAESFLARRLPDTGEVVAEVLEKGDARAVRRAGSDPAALIIAPLRGRDRVLGILYLKRLGDAAQFDPREVDLVRLFAAHASIALQNALTHRAVEIRAQMDALTGLRNHGTFREELENAVAGSSPFALLMLDLDDFKAYNDRHGHEAGNVLLKAIAQAIRRACRSRDLVYRYGGDEFSLVLPDTTLAGAIDVAQRVRMAIREVRGEGRRRPAIRCSVGVATFPDDGTRRADLILAADRALYAAKRAGRDRVATTADGLALADDFVPPSTPVEEALLPSLA
jgi:diguanylate cyclase (GGDEF)-like protein/excisionase family DNA binding protein